MLLSLSVLLLSAAPANMAAAADHHAEAAAETRTERNKRLAREFYEKLWFTNQTDAYADYVAEDYVVHDVGTRKNSPEKAIQQKQIADRFHSAGEMTGRIDYQIAEGDKVATRWFWILKNPTPEAQAMGMTEVDGVPIINVFRFNEEGKIVEIWNHRHDVDLPRLRGPAETAELRNPAAQFCSEQGGSYDLSSGACALGDGTVVDAWDYFRAAYSDAR